jgi:hypothetical protein
MTPEEGLGNALIDYDPFDETRGERESEERRFAAARRAHERWSEQEAKAGRSALHRDPFSSIQFKS